MTPKELNEAGWELAGDCLDILPADNLAVTGLALIHLIAVWLAAVREDARPMTYMQWLDMLHRQLDRAGVMKIHAETEILAEDEPDQASVH